MAPATRARARTTKNMKPLSSAPISDTLAPTRLPHSHVRFDQEEENTLTTAQKANLEIDEISKGADTTEKGDMNKAGETMDTALEEEGEDSDSGDDAPEAVSMGAGKREAEKREEEAKRVVEAQKENSKKKRKERDTKLKEQKAEAEERKRQRDSKRRKLEQDEQDAAIEDQLNREVMAASIEVEATPRSKSSLLLPESLLARVSARSTPPPPREVEDETTDSDMENSGTIVLSKGSVGVSTRLERNRRRREQKKQNKVLKKGVVSVKVLKDEVASRKSMAPPASKKVAHIKESWLNKQGKGVERRSIGGGFIRKK